MRTLVWVAVALGLLLGVGSCADSFRPEYVNALLLSPDSVHISVGETAMMEVVPITLNGKRLPDRARRVQWTVNNPDVATIGENVGGQLTINAVRLGDARVTARLGRGMIQGNVYVQPAGLTSIEITPSSLDVERRTRPRVEAHLYDAAGNEMSPDGFRISWTALDRRIVFVGTPTGTPSDLLALRVGSTSIRLTVGHLVTAIPIVVR